MNSVLPDELPLYGVQLVDAYLLEGQVSRRAKTEGEDEEPTLEASPGPSQISDDGKALDASVAVKVAVPYRDGQFRLQIDCSINGRFVSVDPRASMFWDAFAAREALAVLWPYLRAATAELGRMTGLRVPLLPTLDVKAIVPAEQSSSQPKPSTPEPDERPRKRTQAAIG